MNKLLNSTQMAEADRRTIEELGLPGMVLMENAGANVSKHLKRLYPQWNKRLVLILAGQGNNGGDGFVVARRLLQDGARVKVLLLGQSQALKGDAQRHFQVYQNEGGETKEVGKNTGLKKFSMLLAHAGVVVDAVFGTGLARPVEGFTAELFEHINHSKTPVLAVDIPSGVSADSGKVLGIALKAQWTVTFAAEKIGHRSYPGAALCGELFLAKIGISPQFIDIPEHTIHRNLLDDINIPQRPVDAHKGTFGHVLILAGSVGKEGAAALTAMGALRSGPGLVTVATPTTAQPGVAAKITEAMTLPLPIPVTAEETLATLVNHAINPAALALGPGLGSDDWLLDLLPELLKQFDVPAVIDADGLNVLAKKYQGENTATLSITTLSIATLSTSRNRELILTPHPGEFARLRATSIAKIQENRLQTAMQAAQEWQVWLVLKGAATVIACPDGRAWINETGNSGMAAGGSGDLLTGIIAGLLAQQWPVESAVRVGVWLHGAAADEAAKEDGQVGLLASDLLPYLRQLRTELDRSRA